MDLNRATVEARLFEVVRTHVPAEFLEQSEPPSEGLSAPLTPTCGSYPWKSADEGPFWWHDFMCEPKDKLLQTSLPRDPGEEHLVEWEYLCNETNVLDRLFKTFEFYRNPEVGQGPDCFWECTADQLSRVQAPVTKQEVKRRCLAWLRQHGEHHPMGPECSLPVAEGETAGRRCTLGEYVREAYRVASWEEYVGQLEPEQAWADVLCLFALTEAMSCAVVVCSKTFPYPDFLCHFGKAGAPQVLLAHWKRVQWRSVLSRDEWDRVYEQAKKERGLEQLNHKLYVGLLRYQDRAQEAVMHCELECKRDPQSLVGHHTWSIVLSDNFQSEPALQHYLEQLTIRPDHPHSYNGVGTTLHDLRRYEDAIFFYQAQLYFNPLNKYSHLNMSLAYARLKRHDEAERQHRMQLALHPTDRNTCDYFLELLADMKKVPEGQAFFEEQHKLEPWRNDWLVQIARSHVIQKQYKEATEALQTVLRRNPNDCRALIGLAELLERNGYYKRAMGLLEKVLKVFPRHPRVRSFLGDLLVKNNQFEEAEAVVRDQMKRFPKDSEAYARMAEVFAQRGDTHDAIEMYKKSRVIDPTDSSSLFNIGLCYLELKDFNQARAYFQRHLAENEDDPISLLETANTYYAQGDMEQSIRGYRKVLEVRPDNHDCRAWLAATLFEAGKLKEAIAEYERLIELTEKTAYHYNLSYIYHHLAETSEPEEAAKYRRLSDIHSQLETGVSRECVERFYASLDAGTALQPEVEPRPLGPLTSVMMFRETPLPVGVVWTPENHHLCSALAKQQVKVLLMLTARCERAASYRFPRQLVHMIIREMLAPPDEGFVRSVLRNVNVEMENAFCDEQVTVCFRPLVGAVAEEMVKAKYPDVIHQMILYWPQPAEQGDDVSPFPLKERPPPDVKFVAALYLTFPTAKAASDFVSPDGPLSTCMRRTCSPGELMYVPYRRFDFSREDVAPFEGAVGLMSQQFRNRQMLHATLKLAGEADCITSLSVAASYGLGEENEVKAAISTLLHESRSESDTEWTCAFNSAVIVYLLLVWVAPLDAEAKAGEDPAWEKHFQRGSEYAKLLLGAATVLLRCRPCGDAMYVLGSMLYMVARNISAPALRQMVLEPALELLRAMDLRSPRHPDVLFMLAKAEALNGATPERLLSLYEECAQRSHGWGRMEACRLLIMDGRRDDAVLHLEQEVAHRPYSAYAVFADALFQRLKKQVEDSKAGRIPKLDDSTVRHEVSEVKRFYEVHRQMTESLPQAQGDEDAIRYGEFLEWEAHQTVPAQPFQNRVEFVPRVEETPFGMDDDFEKEFL